jgi:phytoene synthase
MKPGQMESSVPLSVCAERVRRYDNDRFLTALFAPAGHRESLFTLYAFNLELARLREAVHEPLIGRIRLQWWRETMDAAYAGGVVEHEVAVALAAAIESCGLSQARIKRLIEAREFDFEQRPPETLEELVGYVEGTSSTLVELALEALGAAEPAALAAAREVGIAWGLIGILRAVPFHAREGRVMLPIATIGMAGSTAAEVLGGASFTALPHIVRPIAEEAERHIIAARRLRADVPAQALPALLPATLAAIYLGRLRRSGFDPYRAGVESPTPLRHLRLTFHAMFGRY